LTAKPITDEKIRAIRERMAARTPGEWSTSITGPDGAEWDAGMAIAATYGRQKIYARSGGSFPKADQEFIAAAPSDIAALLDEVDRLRKNVESLDALLLDRRRPSKPDEKRVDSGDYIRTGDCVCDRCGFAYRYHAPVQGFEWLRRLCDGRLAKL
jgi:hypothetical protein